MGRSERPRLFGPQLRALGLKKADITVFSRIYGRTDSQAAQDLIDLQLSGEEIRDAHLDGEHKFISRERKEKGRVGWIKVTTRREAAQKVYLELLGQPQKTATNR